MTGHSGPYRSASDPTRENGSGMSGHFLQYDNKTI